MKVKGSWGWGEWVKQRPLLEDFLVGPCLQDATVSGAATDDLAIC